MAATSNDTARKTALLVVDMQEDFCPPNGSLAIEGGRALAPTINKLLSLPYALKIATKDFHPHDHVSFDTSHGPPHNQPFESSITITNPLNPTESRQIPLWPAHCIQGTKGADIIPEIDASKFDVIVEKGTDRAVEMFSPFADAFGNQSSSDAPLGALLRNHAIHHLHIAGLAGDVCVKCTALDASTEGFDVFVVREAVRSVSAACEDWEAVLKEFHRSHVKLVSIDGPEITGLTG